MSRGYGKLQREILQSLERYEAFYLASLASSDTEAKSYHRAAVGLAAGGKIHMFRFAMSMYHIRKSSAIGGPKVVVQRIDGGAADRDELERVYHEIRAAKFA